MPDKATQDAPARASWDQEALQSPTAEAGQTTADSKAHSKYIVPAELSLWNTLQDSAAAVTLWHITTALPLRVWDKDDNHKYHSLLQNTFEH